MRHPVNFIMKLKQLLNRVFMMYFKVQLVVRSKSVTMVSTGSWREFGAFPYWRKNGYVVNVLFSLFARWTIGNGMEFPNWKSSQLRWNDRHFEVFLTSFSIYQQKYVSFVNYIYYYSDLKGWMYKILILAVYIYIY